MRTLPTRSPVLAALAGALLAAPLLATPATALPAASGTATSGTATSGGFIVDGPATGAVRRVPALAVVRLGNGDDVAFTPLLDGRGQVSAVAVGGVRSPGRRAVRAVPGLAAANPLELFVALAAPGSPVPADLERLYTAPAKPQGWARALVIEGGAGGVSCPAQYWQQQLDAHSGAFDDDPFTSTWDGPQTKPQHWGPSPTAPADGHQYRDLLGQAQDVTAFYGSVIFCVEDWENAYEYNGVYVGNYVSSYYRVAGTGTWYLSQTEQLDDVGDVFEHLYAPANPFLPSADAYDFRIRIVQAKPADQFHIGATWVQGPPSDLKAAG